MEKEVKASPTGKAYLKVLNDTKLPKWSRNTALGNLCEAFGSAVLRRYGHTVLAQRDQVVRGLTRRYDQITQKRIGAASVKFYWEGKANTSARAPREKTLDAAAITDGFYVRDYWCSITWSNFDLTKMAIGTDAL